MIIKIHFSLILFSVYLLLINRLKYFIVFYGFVILHELAHIMVASLLKVKVKEITFLSVGVNAQYEENINWIKEFCIASAGPLLSLVLALILSDVQMSTMNFIIFVTNMMPLYPLDGGRITRIFLIKLLGYKNGVKLYGNVLKVLICVLIVLTAITVIYIKNYYLLIFSWYIFLLANREIKKERIKIVINELLGIQL